MSHSPLFGRRIHIAGSIDKDPTVASTVDVTQARNLIADLVKELVKRGANFVVPVDVETTRESDGLPVCFDWLVWQTIKECILQRPPDPSGPLAIAVQHHKNEDQIPPELVGLWDELKHSPWVQTENVAYWNMAAKRMEAQARFGDILVTLGGSEGVLHLANLYHDAGNPIVPLNLPICRKSTGTRRLYTFGLTRSNSHRLFQIGNDGNAHDWINRIRFPPRESTADRVSKIVELLESLERPTAFAVRLLNREHNEYPDVQDFFDSVVEPVIVGELGYRLIVVDGNQAYEHARVDEEIFAKLHRSRVVLADITGARPNCFLELGYALGRSLPTMVMAREGSETPFDIATFAGHRWVTTGTVADRRRAFLDHWRSISNRPPLVPAEPLIR